MDLTPWLEYFVTGLRTQMIQVQEKSTQIIKFDTLIQKAQSLNLPKRLTEAMKFIIQKGEISRAEYVDHFDVSARTANYDLKILEQQELIVQTGIGRAIKYILPLNQ